MRSMYSVLVVVLGVVPAAIAQRGSTATLPGARVDVALGYSFVRANAPPATCECFSMNGGFAAGTYHFSRMLSLVGEGTLGHANNISALGQNLTLTTFTAGPRLTVRRGRITPFGEALFGLAHGSNSYFPTGSSYTSSASSFAYNLGGGVDFDLNRRFAIRALEGQYVHSALPNGTNNQQHHLLIGAGVVVKFNARDHERSARPLPPEPESIAVPVVSRASKLNLWCSTNVLTLHPGEDLEIVGNTMSEPDMLNVAYNWTTTGGQLQGSGREITLATEGLQPGKYSITGHVAAVDDPSVSASCELGFRVNALPEPKVITLAPAPLPIADPKKDERIFHENVRDAFFDYDKAELRPDAEAAIAHAAEYLQLHPEINVLIGGYSDERGTQEYNLTLGVKRADAARRALMTRGVEPGRLQIVSYGKGTQVCTTEDEACWQQNRRAAFMLHP